MVQVHAGPHWLLALNTFGAVAQLGEHLPCTEGVAGSNPVSSTKDFLLFDNLEIDAGRFIENDTLVKLLRAYGGCLGT